MRWCKVLAIPIALLATPLWADGESEGCGIFPPDMPFYGGWSGCRLKELNLPALWKGLPKDAAQITRLTFTDGHAYFFRTVTITRRTDGSGFLTVDGTSRATSIRPAMPAVVRRSFKLTPDDLVRIDRLAEEAGAFKFERGSWDGEEMYMHCQTLDMERVNAAGYRVSVVNIGCNQPAKLMPFVRAVVQFAKLKNDKSGMLFY